MASRSEMLERVAKRVLELFVNGNISDALAVIGKLPPVAAAWVGGYVLFYADRSISLPNPVAGESFWMRCLAKDVSKDEAALPVVELHEDSDDD